MKKSFAGYLSASTDPSRRDLLEHYKKALSSMSVEHRVPKQSVDVEDREVSVLHRVPNDSVDVEDREVSVLHRVPEVTVAAMGVGKSQVYTEFEKIQSP
jgi:hypothetical protein